MALVTGAQGGYATPAGICVQTSQDNIIAEINKLVTLIAPADGVEPARTDWDEVSKNLAGRLTVEIAAITAAIDAMDVA